MALEKVTYTDNQTVITAKNMNDIQDAIIEAEKNVDKAKTSVNYENAQTLTETQKEQARMNIGALGESDFQAAKDQLVADVIAALPNASGVSF